MTLIFKIWDLFCLNKWQLFLKVIDLNLWVFKKYLKTSNLVSHFAPTTITMLNLTQLIINMTVTMHA